MTRRSGSRPPRRPAAAQAPDAPGSDATGPPPKKVIGRPFPKGRSGNPHGRPKLAKPLRERMRQWVTSKGLDTLIQIAEDPTHKDQLAALKLLLEHAIGKPPQQVQLDGGDIQVEVAVQRLALEALKRAGLRT